MGCFAYRFITLPPNASHRYHTRHFRDGVRHGACAVPGFPKGSREKTDIKCREELALPGNFMDGFVCVHQRHSVLNLPGAHCYAINANHVRQLGLRGGTLLVRGLGVKTPKTRQSGSRGGTPLVRGVGAQSPHSAPCQRFGGEAARSALYRGLRIIRRALPRGRLPVRKAPDPECAGSAAALRSLGCKRTPARSGTWRSARWERFCTAGSN